MIKEMARSIAAGLPRCPIPSRWWWPSAWSTALGRHHGAAGTDHGEGGPALGAGRQSAKRRGVRWRLPFPPLRSRTSPATAPAFEAVETCPARSPELPRLPAPGRDPHRARQDRGGRPGARARTAAASAATSSARSWSTWAHRPARRAGGALRSARHPAGRPWMARRPSAPEIDGLSHRFLRQCRAFPLALDGLHAHPRDGRSAGFRDHRRGARVLRAAKSDRRWPPSRKSSTPSRATTAKASGRPSPATAMTSRPTPTSNTCATWPARRRSSAW